MPERALTGFGLYEAHAIAVWSYEDKHEPEWDDLSWEERDAWEARADELNEARRNDDD